MGTILINTLMVVLLALSLAAWSWAAAQAMRAYLSLFRERQETYLILT